MIISQVTVFASVSTAQPFSYPPFYTRCLFCFNYSNFSQLGVGSELCWIAYVVTCVDRNYTAILYVYSVVLGFKSFRNIHVYIFVCVDVLFCLQCFDAVGWAAERASVL